MESCISVLNGTVTHLYSRHPIKSTDCKSVLLMKTQSILMLYRIIFFHRNSYLQELNKINDLL